MTDKELLQQALDALESCYDVYEYPANGRTPQDETIQAIKARLAQPDCVCGEPNSEGVHRKDKPCYVEAEPTVDGWPLYSGLPKPEPVENMSVPTNNGKYLTGYTVPPKRTPLTGKQMNKAFFLTNTDPENGFGNFRDGVEFAEISHGIREKNND